MLPPLLLTYAEEPTLIDWTAPEELVYCPQQNLTVLRATGKPAIAASCLETETFTKSFGEVSDTDRTPEPVGRRYLDTATETRVRQEVSDADLPHYPAMRRYLDTATLTFTQQENSDTD